MQLINLNKKLTAMPVTLIEETGTVLINRNANDAFAFTADLRNDSVWRTEVNTTVSLNNLPGLNHMVEENSFLSKKVPHHVKLLICTEYARNSRIVYQATGNNSFFLYSCRQVQRLSPQQTLFIYSLKFDSEMVRYALGFKLPVRLIGMITGWSMKNYLRKLKQMLETSQ